MNVGPILQTVLKFTAVFGITIALGLVTYDILFSKPLLMKGVIVDKLYVPKGNRSTQNIMPYNRYKSYDYVISAEKDEQWIAFVKVEENQILKVNCHSHHYQQKQIGDTLCFKEYTGEIFAIDYFSHSEEDEKREASEAVNQPSKSTGTN